MEWGSRLGLEVRVGMLNPAGISSALLETVDGQEKQRVFAHDAYRLLKHSGTRYMLKQSVLPLMRAEDRAEYLRYANRQEATQTT
jgi:hypothetical protein